MPALIFTNSFLIILVLLGLLPSTLWLLIYLHQDIHPEPKRMILKIFVWGMLIAPLALVLQYLILSLARFTSIEVTAVVALLSLAAVEEYLKYLVVKIEIEDEPDFDEPTDAMVYMIVAALGFAAVENVLIAFSVASPMSPEPGTANVDKFLDAVRILGIRFLGATLLHAFSSSIVGYFLAQRVFGKQRRGVWIISVGLGIAILLHALFNYLILESSEVRAVVVVSASVAMIAVIVALFNRIRRNASANP